MSADYPANTPPMRTNNHADICDRVLKFFKSYLMQEEVALAAVANCSDAELYTLNKDSLIFSLRALHKLLGGESLISYHEFRQSLFKSTLNHQLTMLGGRVEVFQSVGKVDENLYRLITQVSEFAQG